MSLFTKESQKIIRPPLTLLFQRHPLRWRKADPEAYSPRSASDIYRRQLSHGGQSRATCSILSTVSVMTVTFLRISLLSATKRDAKLRSN